jgi:outer membrane immunogenic protein
MGTGPQVAIQVDHQSEPSRTHCWKGLRTRPKYGTSLIDPYTQRPRACCSKGTGPCEIDPLGFERPFAVLSPLYNWTGFYLGINGGWGFGKSDWSIPGASTGNFNVNGGLIGGTLGYNWWVDGWVLGLEGDFDGSWMDGKASVCGIPNCETKNKWLATIRPRIGYAADRVLFYLTGGVVLVDVVVNTTTNWQSADKTGWTAGAGIEGAFTDHWTARVEYLFVDLQNSTFTPVVGTNVSVKFNANLIRLGVDYKF